MKSNATPTIRTITLARGSALLGAALWLAVAAAAGPADKPAADTQHLTAREYQRLNPQARELYDKALKAFDHVDAQSAITLLDQASQADPDNIELGFVTTRLAYSRGRMVFGDEAKKYYEIADKAMGRIGKQQKDFSPLLKRRYDLEMKVVQEEKKKLEVRDARRKAIGEAFTKIYATERFTSLAGGADGKGKTEGRTEAKKAAPVAPRLPAMGTQMMPGMMPGQQGMMNMQTPGMMQPGMMQPGMMQPGMMQPGMMQPGMMPGQMPMQPGMMPGQMPMQPGMMPGQMPMQPRPPEPES